MSSEEQSKPQRSLNRQQILEEDEYTAAVSEIIARDFFPSLVHLDATNTYLDALQSQDPQQITASVRRLQDLATPLPSSFSSRPSLTPGRTPFGLAGETPLRRSAPTDNVSKRLRTITDISLDEFQAQYTSEDNASFVEILNEENKQRKERWSWAWEAQKRVLGVKAIEDDKRTRLLIENSISQPPGVRERLVIEKPDIKLITGPEAGAANNQQVTTVRQTADLVMASHAPSNSNETVDVMAPRKDTRSAAVDAWSFKVFCFPFKLVIVLTVILDTKFSHVSPRCRPVAI